MVVMKKTAPRKIRESVTAALPKEVAERLHDGPGDRRSALETEGGAQLTPLDPDFRDAMQAFTEVRRQYRNTLKKLAE
jgi:hypothetical protein